MSRERVVRLPKERWSRFSEYAQVRVSTNKLFELLGEGFVVAYKNDQPFIYVEGNEVVITMKKDREREPFEEY